MDQQQFKRRKFLGQAGILIVVLIGGLTGLVAWRAHSSRVILTSTKSTPLAIQPVTGSNPGREPRQDTGVFRDHLANRYIEVTDGSPGGTQRGPFRNFVIDPVEQNNKTLQAKIDQIISSSGATGIMQLPVYLYKSQIGPVQSGQIVHTQNGNLMPEVHLVAHALPGEALNWPVQPGQYFLFVGYTKSQIQTSADYLPDQISYQLKLITK